jgi:DNA-binding NarL/FixJ family response regulator
MSTKRIILANDSRLLRDLLHRVISRADNLEVAQEISDQKELPSAIEKLDPEWVILSLPVNDHAQAWANAWVADYPSVRFIFLSSNNGSIKTSYEEDLTNLSLPDFIHILEKDLQHT